MPRQRDVSILTRLGGSRDMPDSVPERSIGDTFRDRRGDSDTRYDNLTNGGTFGRSMTGLLLALRRLALQPFDRAILVMPGIQPHVAAVA